MAKKSKKNQENLLFLFMGLIIMGLAISGIILFQKQFASFFAEKQTNNQQIVNQATTTNTNSSSEISSKPQEEYIPSEEVQHLQIYYGVKGKDKIESENKKVRRNSMKIGQARQVVNSLLETPSNERLYKLLPENLTLRGLFYDSGLFIVDFSREFNKIYNYGANEQVLAIYSIVNSITELDPKAKVRFLINGTEPEGNEGHIDLSMNLSRLDSIIEK
ncbi:MAG: GerMN domain-containing protein [Candidatus Riflebacteria bacterium]|nr:GerMN domain-containing protein [Candidatus Riflebacteria bacterium]